MVFIHLSRLYNKCECVSISVHIRVCTCMQMCVRAYVHIEQQVTYAYIPPYISDKSPNKLCDGKVVPYSIRNNKNPVIFVITQIQL